MLSGRENLKKIIETYCPEIEILGLADSVINAIEMIKINKPDVVFLDINMPVLNEFDFLEEYDERKFMVVIVSTHEEFGISALKSRGAADYLLKPVSIKELKQTVKKLGCLHNKKKTNSGKTLTEYIHGIKIIYYDYYIFGAFGGNEIKNIFYIRNEIASV